jgi:glutathione synthase/RimK-type ligase-like ATP-grasp enzyme
MKDIVALVNYNGVFGSKWNAVPYRSGMNVDVLKDHFKQLGYNFSTVKFSDFDFFNQSDKEKIVIYTSSEDKGYKYKDFIEDIVLGAQEMGCQVLPDFKYLRANNNKVFMEILRDIMIPDKQLRAQYLSVMTDEKMDQLNYPIIMKESSGAMSTGVSMIHNKAELKSQIKKINRKETIYNYKHNLKDKLRAYKHDNYKMESPYREKFILQEMVPNLKSDFKILVFGERYYIFERPIRKNDFRASGSGNKHYIYGSNVKIDLKMFDYAKEVYEKLDVPQASLDICDNGERYSLFEFQALYFGTVGQFKSDGYYMQENEEWIFIEEKLELEQVYAESIHSYLSK